MLLVLVFYVFTSDNVEKSTDKITGKLISVPLEQPGQSAQEGSVSSAPDGTVFRVAIEKSTGKLIEAQQYYAPLGTLTQNAVNAGYKKEDVEEKYVTAEEWGKIKYEQIIKPAQEQKKAQEEVKKQQQEIIRNKLNLTEQEFENLKELLNEKK